MSWELEPEVTTRVEGHHVFTEVTYTNEVLDRVAREMAKEVDDALFARMAMERGYVPNSMFFELRELIRDLWPRAEFTMSPANRESWLERMKSLGVVVDA